MSDPVQEALLREAAAWDSWNADHPDDAAVTTPPLLRQAAAAIEQLRAEVDFAWTAANRAEAKVRAWEGTMVCAGMPRRFAPIDGWGPGAEGVVEVPALTTEKLTDILDRLEAATAEAAQLRAEKEAAERDAARWNAWCERHPLTTYRALTGEGIEGKPYKPDKINAAMDEVIASGEFSLRASRLLVVEGGEK